jgi:hypothetical protein
MHGLDEEVVLALELDDEITQRTPASDFFFNK